MNKKYVKKLKLKKEIKEDIKAILYVALVAFGLIALMLLIGIVENARF